MKPASAVSPQHQFGTELLNRCSSHARSALVSFRRRSPHTPEDRLRAAMDDAAKQYPRVAELLERELEGCRKVASSVALGREIATRMRLFTEGTLSAHEFEAFLVERQLTGADAAYALAAFRVDIVGADRVAGMGAARKGGW